MKDFTFVAEIGCAHIGSIDRAKELAKLAKLSGADVLKTQKRNPYESTNKKLWDSPHPNKMYSYGNTYLEHRLHVELSIDHHKQLKEYCEEIGILYASSVFDITSAKEIISLNPKYIKIPSACNDNVALFNILLNEYDGDIHISLGMTTEKERNNLYQQIEPHKNRIVVYHCTSGYPVPFNKIYLKEILILAQLFNRIGFSNHGYGIALEPVAYSLGARWFERHFIDDRMYPHTDAACSLEPQGLSKVIRDIKAVSDSLSYKPSFLEEIEKEQRDKLRVT